MIRLFNFQNSKKIHKNVFSENILLFGQHINEINVNLIYFLISTGSFLIFQTFIMSSNVGISITFILQPIPRMTMWAWPLTGTPYHVTHIDKHRKYRVQFSTADHGF